MHSDEHLQMITYKADLLVSFMHTWKEKDLVVVCQDFNSQEPVRIEIPHGTTPSTVAKKLYTQTKKLKRSASILSVLLQKVSEYREYLESIDTSLALLDSYRSFEDLITVREIVSELESVQKELHSIYSNSEKELSSSKSSISPSTTQKNKKPSLGNGKSTKKEKKDSQSSPVVVTGKAANRKALKGLLVLEDNEEVATLQKTTSLFRVPLVVGRNSNQNERVSFELARAHHKWFHVQGIPGSHCLLLLQPGEEPSEEALQAAADVAAFYSKARGSTSVPVGYCSPKHIRRAVGGVPGMVQVSVQEGMIYGDPTRGGQYVASYGPSLPVS
jgi:predicted ribosome quality control (RQC) complex YloA/Tae2 family protein